MNQNEKTCELLIEHCKKFPKLLIQDVFKYLYQSSFGCEHMISSLESATDYIRKESECIFETKNLIEPLDGNYSRVHLGYLNNGLSITTFGKLFFESAKKEPQGIMDLENKLSVTRKLIKEKKLSFSSEEFDALLKEWKDNNYPSIHHSEVFRNEYKPTYRVIANKFIPFLPFFAELDKMSGRKIVAIEGGSGSGKTTLGNMLESIYDCTVIHMDDFFLQPAQRTPERFSEVGGNIDRERFLEEVLIPLSKNEELNYRKFDCSSFTLMLPEKVIPKDLVIIEGAYSMHPEFVKYYDFSLFLDISAESQKARIEKRNSPQMAERFFGEWIPLEEKYFSKTNIKNRCNMTISVI